jgi:hypothetical protein
MCAIFEQRVFVLSVRHLQLDDINISLQCASDNGASRHAQYVGSMV